MGVSAEKRQPGEAVALPTFREQGIDVVYAAYRGIIGPGGLSAAQRAYWDAAFAKVANSDGWKKTQLEHAWDPDYKDSATTRRYLDTEYAALRKILSELGVTK
jgi:putative tricarboxylic transport membrane protein